MTSSKSNTPLADSFLYQEIEQKWRNFWYEQGYFESKKNSKGGPTYCIMIPPPNITGTLHMGHAFQHTLMDVLVRYHRMQGYDTLWQMGTDHAGIATQMVVERQLAKHGVQRSAISREDFIRKVWEWKEASSGRIKEQIFAMGSSVDWQSERFTMDTEMSLAVREVFTRLYDEGIIYRGSRLVNWDTKLQTAVSDLEVVKKNIKELGQTGYLYTIAYHLQKGGEIAIATTRPETLFGDTALAVHPSDARFTHLIGQHAYVPISRRLIPIVADQMVDKTFGTGCVKITPAHDFKDHALGERHQLPCINIMHPDGRLNDQVPESYQNLDRFVARAKLLEALHANHQLLDQQVHDIVVPVGDRSNSIIEPYITSQWFLRVNELAKDAITLVKNGDIRFIPSNWVNEYCAWMDNIQDWCISRQLWWGHRINAWYDGAGNVYVATDESRVREKYALDDDFALHQDEDVLDTWFSSALWTFVTLGWPEKTDRLARFHPTNVLVTGFDIIFFWVARMVMMTKKIQQEVPFRVVYVTGLIRDMEGKKMSKTKGNVIDPLDLVQGIALPDLIKKQVDSLVDEKKAPQITKKLSKFFPNGIAASGTDAVRFNFCALANSGRDINFDYNRLLGYHHFVNKIWHAARFVLGNCEQYTHNASMTTKEHALSSVHVWIVSRLHGTIRTVEQQITSYRFDLAANALFDFFWHDYCNWYLEFAKVYLRQEMQTTQRVLLVVLEQFLRLLHPMMPFVTEDLWQRVARYLMIDTPSICIAPYPVFDRQQLNPLVHAEFTLVTDCITAIRSLKGKHRVPPAQRITAYIQTTEKEKMDALRQYNHLINKLTNVIPKFDAYTAPAALEITGAVSVRLPFNECVDRKKETVRLKQAVGKLQANITQLEAVLQNSQFTTNAPAAIVAAKRAQLHELQKKQTLILQELAELSKVNNKEYKTLN